MSDRLMLIGCDAADWKLLHPLLDAGEMPALNRLVEAGVSGELLCTQPALPAMLLCSAATGKRAWQHGVCQSQEPGPDGSRTVPVSSARRRSPALWRMLAEHGKRSIVLGWPATQGEQGGNLILISDRYPEPTAGPGIKPWPPAVAGTYWPEGIGARLDAKRVSPEDIGANVISQYVSAWKKVDQKRDHRIGQLRLFLAADYSIQSAALELLKTEPWEFAAIRFPALAPIFRLFLPHHLARERPSSPANQEQEIYQHVIRTACRVFDRMLRQLIELAGPATDVMVFSGHGIRTINVPPNGFPPRDHEAWKTPYGIFAACGGRFLPDALLHGAGILDIAPTVLTWFGLPMGDDMEGRVLMESFKVIPEVSRLNSWDSVVQPATSASAENSGPAAVSLRREAEWNFVQSCLEASRFEEALPILSRQFREFPERVEFGHALFQCQLALGLLADAAVTLEVTLEFVPVGISSILPRAELALARGDFREARSLVAEARALHPSHPLAIRKLGILLLRLREWNALADIARQALAVNEQDAIAWLGLAAAQLRRGKPDEAVEAATRAIGLKYFLPDAHFVLARGLLAQGRWEEASEAMQAMLKLQPNNRVAATYYKRMAQANNPANGRPEP